MIQRLKKRNSPEYYALVRYLAKIAILKKARLAY